MKYLILTLLITLTSNAQYTCEQKQTEQKKDINTPVPKGLEGSKIIVRQVDGTESVMDIKDFKVVPRKQQLVTQVIEKTNCKPVVVEKEENLNLVMVGLRKDHKNIEIEQYPNSATVYSKKGPVVDATYYRRKIIDEVGAGISIDSNSTVRGVLGVEF